jgi:hypothetical protein
MTIADHGPRPSPHGKAALLRIGEINGDIGDLQLEMEDLRVVTGRISGDGVEGCSDGAFVSMQSVDSLPGAEELAAPLNHGAFTIPDVPPGRYWFQFRGLDGSCYVKQIRSADLNAANGILTVSGITQVELVLAAASATLSGTITLPDGKSPVAKAQVVLIAAEDGIPEDRVWFASSTSEGLFQFEHVPPGEYQVLALRKIESLDYLDPVFAAEHGALRITVKPGRVTTIEVTLR